MKSLKIIFSLAVLVIIGLYSHNLFNDNPEKVIKEWLPYKNDDLKPRAPVVKENAKFDFVLSEFSSLKDYGITTDGTFFISSKLIPGVENFTLVILPEDTEHNEKKVRETFEKEYYPMVKIGDYFFAKPDKVYSEPLYYYKSGHFCFPACEKGKFANATLLENDFGGYVIKAE